jgi:phosphoglucosamine mutase
VRVSGRPARETVAAATVQKAVAAAERVLKDAGRVLLRPSGTEPVIRVMVEGPSLAVVRKLASGIARAVSAAG